MDYRGDRPAGGFGPGVRGRVLDATLADLATQNLREQEYHDRMEDRERRRERRGSVSFEEERARMAQRQLQLATAGGAKDESIGSGAGIDASRGGGGGGGAGEATPSDEDGDEDGENDEDFDEDEDSFDEGDDGQLSRLMKSTIEQTLNSYRWAEGAEARAASDKSTRANRAGLERELHELKQSGQLDDALHAQFLRMIKEATGTKSKKIKDSGDGAAGGDARKKRGGASQMAPVSGLSEEQKLVVRMRNVERLQQETAELERRAEHVKRLFQLNETRKFLIFKLAGLTQSLKLIQSHVQRAARKSMGIPDAPTKPKAKPAEGRQAGPDASARRASLGGKPAGKSSPPPESASSTQSSITRRSTARSSGPLSAKDKAAVAAATATPVKTGPSRPPSGGTARSESGRATPTGAPGSARKSSSSPAGVQSGAAAAAPGPIARRVQQPLGAIQAVIRSIKDLNEQAVERQAKAAGDGGAAGAAAGGGVGMAGPEADGPPPLMRIDTGSSSSGGRSILRVRNLDSPSDALIEEVQMEDEDEEEADGGGGGGGGRAAGSPRAGGESGGGGGWGGPEAEAKDEPGSEGELAQLLGALKGTVLFNHDLDAASGTEAAKRFQKFLMARGETVPVGLLEYAALDEDVMEVIIQAHAVAPRSSDFRRDGDDVDPLDKPGPPATVGPSLEVLLKRSEEDRKRALAEQQRQLLRQQQLQQQKAAEEAARKRRAMLAGEVPTGRRPSKSFITTTEGGFHEGAWKLRLGDLTAEGLARQREQEQLKEGQLRRAIELLRTKVLAVEARRNSILQQHPALVETAISHDHAMMQSVPGSIHMNVLSIDIVNTNIYVVAGGPARP